MEDRSSFQFGVQRMQSVHEETPEIGSEIIEVTETRLTASNAAYR